MLPPDPDTPPPEAAWDSLPANHWREGEAAHLLRRIGFSATPARLAEAARKGPRATLDAAFSEGVRFPAWPELETFVREAPERRKAARMTEDREERRRIRRELRQRNRELFHDFALRWFRFAREPEHSAREKAVLFLQDVFVVEWEKVRDTPALRAHQQLMRDGLAMRLPELCKAVSRSPAMVRYLDLEQSSLFKPNENFARELFELFILGEGNYTEKDIKEAARAFTGYRVNRQGEFYFQKQAHDDGLKTVFGETGHWTGDDVIDIAFRQPAAKRFFVREFLAYYLDASPVDERYVAELGERWASGGFRVRWLIDTVFNSRLFYHPAFRGNSVKSPVHFYLGLCQDLQLDVMPFDGRLLRALRAMGQRFFDPPNVRGWQYGVHWINATTVGARRQLVDHLFSPLRENNLNGDEQSELEAAREAGRATFVVTDDRLRGLLGEGPGDLAEHLLGHFIPAPCHARYRPALERLARDMDGPEDLDRLRGALVGLLQSPAYHLS